MKIITSICCATILMLFISCHQRDKEKTIDLRANNPMLEKHIGRPFQITGLMDTLGIEHEIDFTKTPLTIIDIWMGACPPCIKDMNQFTSLLKGKEDKISVVSISINTLWGLEKEILRYPQEFTFLKSTSSNWKMFFLITKETPNLHNDIAAERVDEIEAKWGTNAYPMYFVVNKEGIIQAVPMSAAAYLESI